MLDEIAAPDKKPKRAAAVYQLPDGTPIKYPGKGKWKFFKDIIRYHNGVRRFEKNEIITVPDANLPLNEGPLQPGKDSPICAACGLDVTGCKNPYMEYVGTENPVATILVESVSRKEDRAGQLGSDKSTITWLAGLINKLQDEHGVSLDEIRWVPITRCASYGEKMPNYRTKGNWCRHHAIQDLMAHPPKVVIPVGTAVLGLLSHKSNAGDWSGRLLTWRGWPDDWLTEPEFILDRPDPLNPEQTVRGHPLYGPAPASRISMVPLQSPYLVLSAQNEVVFDRWKKDLVHALQIGRQIIPPPDYNRPWYWISTDPDTIIAALETAIAFAEADPEFRVAYDTETTGLKQWAYFKRTRADGSVKNQMPGSGAAIKANEQDEDVIIRSSDPRIVFMMFRWTNPRTGAPESIGFPWDYSTSEIKPHIERITPYVLTLLGLAQVVGHNLTFDELFTIATVGKRENEHVPFNPNGTWNRDWLLLQERINLLADAARWDTWHMAFTSLQKRGSLGLEILAYDWVPDLAGYEEEMTLLISLHGDSMNPANGKGGHYANCPKELWDTHLCPYVMGDVEVTYQARDKLATRLQNTKVYKIPLSNPDRPERFRLYLCPNRDWVYHTIVSPASRTLTKMMARGMYIDPDELVRQEKDYPEKVQAAKLKLRDTDPDVERWCQTKLQESKKEAEDQDTNNVPWELDLENKSQLKELLFDTLHCPIQRLTKNGRKLYGLDPADWQHLPYAEQKAYAAVDKYTLNRLLVDHPNLRPLQEYRKVYKLYSTYVRPMRNMMADRLDKKQRIKEPHLSIDHCVHASFMLTGTRSGRLSSRDPNLQQLPLEGLVKRLFASRFKDRGCIYTADLSQIELRLMAVACGDNSMVQAYRDNVDIHSLTASKITWQGGEKISYEQFTKDYMEQLQKKGKSDRAKELELKRKIAKTTNFLTGYGGGAFGLQNVLANNEVYMPLEDCEEIIISFFEAYPTLKRFLGVYKSFIDENGVAVSMFGRVRQFQEVYGEDQEAAAKALRAGCNHLIQSTASDMMLICLFTIEALMRQANLNSLLVSTVHDSLVIDALRDELPEVHAIVDGVMNHIPDVFKSVLPGYDLSWMIVPFAGDSECGKSYGELRKISQTKGIDWDKILDDSSS